MRYYIADCHFFHNSLNFQMDNRGFADAEEMNAYMIAQWNKKVRWNDEVVILGDFSLGKAEETNRVLEQLNGFLYLIEGNHDQFGRAKGYNAARFKWIRPYAELHDNGRKVVLCHYPILCYNGTTPGTSGLWNRRWRWQSSKNEPAGTALNIHSPAR